MRIFLAESDHDLRLAYQMLLHQEAGLYVIGISVEAEGLLAKLKASQAEVLMLDWHLYGASMLDLLPDICALVSSPKIVVLSVKPEEKVLALSAGADAFLSKNAPPDELLEVVLSLKKNSANA